MQQRWDQSMLRQWFAQSLGLYTYIKTPRRESDGFVVHQAYQTISSELTAYVVPTFRDETSRRVSRLVVQPFEMHSRLPTCTAEEIHIYPFEDPCKMDILELLGNDLQGRWALRQWTSVEPFYNGLICLQNPQPVVPKLALPSVDYRCCACSIVWKMTGLRGTMGW